MDQGLHGDLVTVMHENTSAIHKAFPEGSFLREFWDQQLENLRKTDPRQYRWQPLMIKWCLNFKLMSSAGYQLCDLVALLCCHQKEHSEITLTILNAFQATNKR